MPLFLLASARTSRVSSSLTPPCILRSKARSTAARSISEGQRMVRFLLWGGVFAFVNMVDGFALLRILRIIRIARMMTIKNFTSAGKYAW